MNCFLHSDFKISPIPNQCLKFQNYFSFQNWKSGIKKYAKKLYSKSHFKKAILKYKNYILKQFKKTKPENIFWKQNNLEIYYRTQNPKNISEPVTPI